MRNQTDVERIGTRDRDVDRLTTTGQRKPISSYDGPLLINKTGRFGVTNTHERKRQSGFWATLAAVTSNENHHDALVAYGSPMPRFANQGVST